MSDTEFKVPYKARAERWGMSDRAAEARLADAAKWRTEWAAALRGKNPRTIINDGKTNEGKRSQQPFDPVERPAHYNQGEIECIDAIAVATTSLQGIEAVCTGNAIKYLWRWKGRNGKEDLWKARWYIDKLLARLDASEA